MDKEKEKFIQQILYEKDIEEVLKVVQAINDPEMLYMYAYNYNWDNGFEIPKNIIFNDCCDLSTALMIFYSVDGYRYLQKKDEKNDSLKEWSVFIKELYNRILKNSFIKSNTKFVPPLNKVQIFKLKKVLGMEEHIFLEEIGSNDLNISL
ncbi:protein of unknown function [Anaerocolumna jejuensis DSM 15929]|uniref:DUF4274 domain-containing protein n=1 Tax=Anaerocolumna jejuensis DSM 15929 TaxID=1121322 RepID=A0A1M6ZH40_9FIRM|nr:DUF4274 domain-containing protein [Anaerocolumna jejuensis]SHL29694.1 protein of unknown function [Anaerocolumna jejuensis DSM 15929]